MESEKEYLIDIASDSTYAGQTEEYRTAFTEWRMKENNRYGYKYVKDTREHTYAFGEGFETELASDSERTSLKYCSCIIGGTLLMSAVIRFFQVMYDSRAGHLLAGSSIEVYGNPRPADAASTVILSMFKPFSILVCILLMWLFTRLPRKVFIPQGKIKPARHIYGLLGLVVGEAAACYILSILLKLIFNAEVMSVPGGFVWCNDMGLNVHCFGMQYLITPLLHAILVNGMILQLLRQFGDSTAIILSAAVESIMAINLTNIGTHFVLGILICIVTIKTGSIKYAVISRVLINLVFFTLKYIDTSYPNGESELYLLLASALFLGIGLFSLGRLISFNDYKINIRSSETQLPFIDKLKTFVTAMPTLSWLAASMIVWLYIVVS